MRTLLSRSFCFIVLISVPFLLPAQVKSDYQVTQEFEKESQAIAQAVEIANTVVECVDVESRITTLEETYKEYKALLDRALYPDGFDGRIMKLRGQISYAKGKITIIETQYARISELEAQVRELTGQVEKLSGENSAMLGEVKRLSASKMTIDSLNAVIIKLRQGLRDRDGLIFALVDSLFLQYDKDAAAMNDKEREGVAARLERKNVFSSIKKAVNDNLQFLEATSLTGNDIAKLTAEQQKFESKWKAFGKKLANVYVSGKSARAKEVALIDTMLTQWKGKLDGMFWKSLNGVFGSHQVSVTAFSTGEEFYANVSSYLEEEIRKARDEKDGQRYFRFQAFADSVWDAEVKPAWIPAMIEGGKLTRAQVDTLEGMVDEWSGIVSPPLTMVYVIIGIIMVVVVFYLYRRYLKTKKSGGSGEGGAPAS
ncbi:MAG TPA: hypothetical protein VJN65_03020 [Bacteroidota bacterium]|nr:hypothetical protein [Bacteroidota bacterium]